MTAEELYAQYAQRVALQAQKEMDARPKAIVLPELPPEPCACGPAPTLH